MSIKMNIAMRPYSVVLRRGGTEITAVFWAENRQDLKERLAAELGEKIELVSIKER